METLYDKFLRKSPHYPTVYSDNVVRQFSEKAAYDTGGRKDEEEVFAGGRSFRAYYELFLYAAFLGINKREPTPFDRSKEGKKFLPIGEWKTPKINQFLFMSLITLTKFDLEKVNGMSEKELDDAAFQLVTVLEEYANTGYELLNSAIRENPNAFESPYSTVLFLKENLHNAPIAK